MEDMFSLGNVLLYGEFPGKGKEKTVLREKWQSCLSQRFSGLQSSN